ncbi:gastrula zinc finger protein XlCGF48.2-like [Ranitomeya imitator]|uniref:gastrula zinc finger protein XlCGF48.2-like n=1 Tax=Ranitomeya imitator TaxID=111125 RepID=UPI0037E83184
MDRSHMTGEILSLTLKIIYLLTGEDYVPIKKSDDDNITEPLTPAHEKENDEKILDLTNKIIELLTAEGEHLEEVKDEPVTNTEEDACVWTILTCKEEDIPMNISTDQSCQDCPQENVTGIQCGEEIATSISSGESKVSHMLQRPVDAADNIADFPDGRRMDSFETMNASLNIVVIDGGEGEQQFKEEEDEIPMGARSDGSRIKLQEPPLIYIEDEESDDSEMEEDEDNDVSGVKIINSEEIKSCIKINEEEVASNISSGGKDTATSTADVEILPFNRKMVTSDKPFYCADCGGFFKNKSSLILHRRIHSGENPFTCSQCGEEFIQKENYIRHQRLHMAEKPYKCAECGKIYAQRKSLIMHQKFHAENEPLSCPLSGQNFIRQSHLVTHKKTHKGLKRYPCPDCGDVFMLRSSLVIHQRVHSAERPFSS